MDSKFKVKKMIMEDPENIDTDMGGANPREGPEMDVQYDYLHEVESDDEYEEPEFNSGPFYTGYEYQARVINNEESIGNFCISFWIQDKTEREQYVQGEEIEVALFMSRNPIPTKRELAAVARVSKALNKKSTFKFKALQNFLMGKGNPDFGDNLESILQEAQKRMTPEEWKNFVEYKESIDMNKSQLEIYEAIFNHRWFVTQLQGPPGTGKTYTVSLITMSFALLQMKTALCAPSDVATMECLKGVVSQFEAMARINPTIIDTLKIVYLPTTATTKANLRDTGDQQAAYDMLTEGEARGNDPYSQYHLHAHIVQSFESRARLQIGDFAVAQQWLDVRKKLLLGGFVNNKLLRQWVDTAIAEGETVLKDPRVKIVISTSNNAEQMTEYGYKPFACVIDECAFGKEQESTIPLSLGARFNCLVGDHEQLRPMVRSRGFNEFAAQLGLSLYERFYGHHSVPLYRLKINYRMHPDIASLPGMLCYDWLGCAPSTLLESDAYKYFAEWFNSNSDLTGHLRKSTRKPEFGGKADQGIRNRWINVPGFASAAPGSTSLRNFANINVCIAVVTDLLMHKPTGQGVKDLRGDQITILSPYKADLDEVKKQLKWVLNDRLPDFQCIPEGTTIDKIQGGQNNIIILLLRQHHSECLGFMKEWNRFNVALTRAKDVLYIIGNLDGLRKYLKVIAIGHRCRKLGLMIIDYLEQGRVMDMRARNVLPRDEAESVLVSKQWTKHQSPPNAQKLQFSKEHEEIQKNYDSAEQKRFEALLLKDLKERRVKAEAYRAAFEAGETFELPIYKSTDAVAVDPEENAAAAPQTDNDTEMADATVPAVQTENFQAAKATSSKKSSVKPSITTPNPFSALNQEEVDSIMDDVNEPELALYKARAIQESRQDDPEFIAQMAALNAGEIKPAEPRPAPRTEEEEIAQFAAGVAESKAARLRYEKQQQAQSLKESILEARQQERAAAKEKATSSAPEDVSEPSTSTTTLPAPAKNTTQAKEAEKPEAKSPANLSGPPASGPTDLTGEKKTEEPKPKEEVPVPAAANTIPDSSTPTPANAASEKKSKKKKGGNQQQAQQKAPGETAADIAGPSTSALSDAALKKKQSKNQKNNQRKKDKKAAALEGGTSNGPPLTNDKKEVPILPHAKPGQAKSPAPTMDDEPPALSEEELSKL